MCEGNGYEKLNPDCAGIEEYGDYTWRGILGFWGAVVAIIALVKWLIA